MKKILITCHEAPSSYFEIFPSVNDPLYQKHFSFFWDKMFQQKSQKKKEVKIGGCVVEYKIKVVKGEEIKRSLMREVTEGSKS